MRVSRSYIPLLAILAETLLINTASNFAQSIGYHSNLNLGFNPYQSPVLGYGLGLPYGAYGGLGPLSYQWLANPLLGAGSLGPHVSGLLGKLHAKTFLKKYATSPFYGSYNGFYGSGGPRGLKSKLALLKHPEYQFSPYGLEYGYGKHYGSAMVPNNPYKSAYADYYNSNPVASSASLSEPLVSSSSLSSQVGHGHVSSTFSDGIKNDPGLAIVKSHGHMIKPLLKAGALLTTAVIFGKKSLEQSVPLKLNPAGMISSASSLTS